ncbi:MAG: C25 family cysteine peptidase, partial [Ignavibacteriae bacterium]|nr:C25 family cysteine peptidase [Ignavibacteriota bacterium]
KKNISSSQFYQNNVPVYGNPPTDGYYANMNDSTFTYYHQVSVGRLPVYTNQEAQDVVNKVIAYESQGLPIWIKKPVFIAGGYDKNDQPVFVTQSNNFINSYITPPPISSDPVRIYLNDTSGLVTYNYSDSIKNSINRGSLIVNFIAHAGNGYWDYVFSDPVVLSNQQRLPLVFSMTCFTGKNAEPNNRGYGEKFTVYPDKGSLGFISTTGWSFNNTGNIFNDYLFKAVSLDTLRRIGDILKNASGRMYPDSANFASRNTINCYNLLGDPAAKLLIPVNPEFDIQSNDLILSNPFPSLRESISLTIYPKNLGTYADSCKIRYQLFKNNQSYRTKDTIVYSFRFIDTINYNFMMDSAGNYVMKIILDPDNWYPQEIKTNNVISIPITLKNVAFVPLKPIDNQVIANDTIEFVGINPNINPSKYNVKLLLQIDTTKLFNSPLNQTYFKTNMSGVVTKFKVRMPILDSNIVYFWKIRTVINDVDSSGWTELRRIKLSISTLLSDKNSNTISYDSICFIGKKGIKQYSVGDFYHVDSNFNLTKYQGTIVAQSLGENPWNPTFCLFNNQFISISGVSSRGGMFVFKVNKLNGFVLQSKHIMFSSVQSSDTLITFLNAVDTNQIFALVKTIPINATNNLSIAAKNKLREFGSVYADSVNLLSWYSWSFISYNKLPNFITSEKYELPDIPAVSKLEPYFLKTFGTITHTFGPAHSWKNFSWEQVLYPYSNIKFDVYGVDRNNNPQLLMPDVTANNFVDLSGINAYQYPYLKLITKLSIDSINGYQSPVFRSITFNYVPASELALDNNSTIKSDSIVTMGDSVGFGITYYNVGFTNVNGVVRNFFAYDQNGSKVNLKTDTVQTALKIDSSGFIKATLPVSRMPIFKKYNNQVNFNFEVQPLAQQNEIYTYNNTVNSNFFVKGSPLMLNLDVFSDGVKIMGGDYVRLKPEILVKLSKQNSDSLTMLDTSFIRIFVNNNILIFAGNKRNINGGVITETGKDALTLKFTPELKAGQNEFRFITMNAG